MTDQREIIPMTSVRVGDGVYEVVGTSRSCVVQRAYWAPTIHDDPRPSGWHLIVDGEWWHTYATKREALQACQRHVEL